LRKKAFSDDYGLCFKFIWEGFKTDARTLDMFERIVAIEKYLNQTKGEKEEESITLLSGKKIKKRTKSK